MPLISCWSPCWWLQSRPDASTACAVGCCGLLTARRVPPLPPSRTSRSCRSSCSLRRVLRASVVGHAASGYSGVEPCRRPRPDEEEVKKRGSHEECGAADKGGEKRARGRRGEEAHTREPELIGPLVPGLLSSLAPL